MGAHNNLSALPPVGIDVFLWILSMRIKIVLGERRKSRFRSLVARSKNLVGDLFSIGGIWSLPTQNFNFHIPVLVYIAAEAANIN